MDILRCFALGVGSPRGEVCPFLSEVAGAGRHVSICLIGGLVMLDAPTDHASKDSAADLTIAAILDLVKAGQIELGCDMGGRPIMRIPDEPSERLWPLLRSDRVRVWIAWYCYRQTGALLMDREIDRITNVVEGEAFARRASGDPWDEGLLREIENDCVAVAILRYMEERDRCDESVDSLFKTLDTRWKGKARKWPGASWVFSHRLRQCAVLLGRAGLSVRFSRGNRGCRAMIERSPPISDAASVIASPRASPSNSAVGTGLEASEASSRKNTADALARLNQMKASAQDPNRSGYDSHPR